MQYTDYKYNSDIVPISILGSTLRPNMNQIINLEYSSRRIITNKRGWRVSKSNKGVYQSPVMVAGCSWAEGVHENWENTYTSIIEKTFNLDVANIGVSSYSLLQIARRIKSEVDIVKPNIIVISYLSSHINRCFKYNAALGLIHRPIYRIDNNGKYKVNNPVILPVSTFNYLFSFVNKKSLSILNKSILYFSKKIMYLLEGAYSNKYIDPLNGESVTNVSIRKNTLKLFFNDLEKICVKHNCKVLLCGMPGRIFNNEDVRLVYNDDDDLINALLSEDKYYNNFKYIESSNFLDEMNKHVKNNRYFGSVWAKDNPHPNGLGYEVIGKVISKKMKILLNKGYWNFSKKC